MTTPGLALLLVAALSTGVALADALPRATVTADTTCSGYAVGVLTDGKWVVLGQEITQVYGHRDALGNCGNSWVSAPTAGVEHWVRLDWPQPVTLNQVGLWWTKPQWWPKAVRVAMLSDANWVSLTGPGDWLRPTAQHSVITFPAVTARTIRLLQHPRGGEAERGFLALQEITPLMQPEARPGLEGMRKLTADELKALELVTLERNIARLHETQPDASRGVVWGRREQDGVGAPELVDGKLAALREQLPTGARVGVAWPIPHVLDGAALFFAGALPPTAPALMLLGADGHWLPVQAGLKLQRDDARHCLTYAFEPAVTTALAFAWPAGCPPPVEIEAYRYLPVAPNVWPDRLVSDAFTRSQLTSGQEPSFEALATAALPMTPARALLGLKDDQREVGVTWDGDVLSSVPLRVSFGDRRERLADSRDTVSRCLAQGWMPATVTAGRLADLGVTLMAGVGYAGPGETCPCLLLTVLVTRSGEGDRLRSSVNLTLDAKGQPLTIQGDRLLRGSEVVLIGEHLEAFPGDPNTVRVPFELGNDAERIIKVVQPLSPAVPEFTDLRRLAETLGEQPVAYWDSLLKPAAVVEVPEARVNNLYKAVLTQLFINADGDVMPYGSYPSVYDGNLYGVEEGYAMMALAQSGFSADAERYMDHTYLTPQFLVKVPEYKKYADRHQQYRNGLQPSYAIRLYRLTRNRAWIETHLPLIRECAEWTVAQRRRTMVLENGEKPLHWGLLPKWSYGGDISELQCYALYANFCCWKGLVDTAWLLDDLGDKTTAERYRQEAADYRACLDRAVEGNVLRDRTPPFLPLQLYAKAPVGNDYDQLFIGCLLDLTALEPGGQQMRYLTDWMEQDNRTFCLLPRFRRDVGPGGLDGLYGLGYMLSKLQQDQVNEFLLGFYAYLAFSMDHTTFASRETNLLYASDLHVRSQYRVPDMSDPVPCSSAVAMLLLREMLVMEAPAKWGEPNTELRLLYGTPRAWFEHGKTIRLENLPTEFGPVSLRVDSAVGQGSLTATVRPPTRNPWQRLVLRLRHPEGKHWRRVLVNGRPHAETDPARELVILKPGPSSFSIKVEY
ncbi:hypothetical protein LLH23_18390 [bacterium]|nr:hypothetical protein [bacterium]